MNYVWAVIVAWSLSGALLFGAPADSLTNEFARLQGVYTTAVAAIDVKYQALLANAPTQYLQGLDTLEKAYQQKGEFKSVMAVRAERDQVNRILFAPGKNIDSEAIELRALKIKTRALLPQYDEQKANEKLALTSTYFIRLEALQRELTKAGLISNAATIQVEMDKIIEYQKTIESGLTNKMSAVENNTLSTPSSPETEAAPASSNKSEAAPPLSVSTTKLPPALSNPGKHYPSNAIAGICCSGNNSAPSPDYSRKSLLKAI